MAVAPPSFTRILAMAGVLALAAGTAAAEQPPATVDDLMATGDLVCEMRASGPQRSARGLMLVFDGVTAGGASARVVSSGRAGARRVRLYAGETGVHLVEDIADSVVVTTLLACETRDPRDGRCLRYSAVNAWHFDRSVHRDADGAFRRLPGTSYAGTCEAWHMDLQQRAGSE